MKSKVNSWLHSVPLLYLVFLFSLLHLGYFVLHRNTESLVFFVMISTFVYLLYPNMIVVLVSTMFLTDLLYAVKRGIKREGFDGSIDGSMNPMDGSMNPMDGSMNDMDGTINKSEGFDPSMNPFIRSTKSEPTQYLESFVKGMFQKENAGNDLAELDSESSLLDKKIKFTKETTPELSDPELSDVSKINMTEFNTLMSRLNTMLGTVSD